jgi:colanic acid/amylovoran biosynthesis glycosyltransferase
MRVCIVQRSFTAVPTFIRAHDERLPGVVGIVSRDLGVPALDGQPVLDGERPRAALRRLVWMLRGRSKLWEMDHAYETAFRRTQADVVLVEYGTHGIKVVNACRRAAVPLVVHFHGADASKHKILKRHAVEYRRMFAQAAAVIAVSRAMERRLVSLGCPAEKLIYIPCGVDCDTFLGATPLTAPPQFVTVGRMVEKKGPQQTLMAFARVLKQFPDARLRMIGDGELLGPCRDLAASLEIDHAVVFLGSQPHEVVRQEMQQARAFVQHSITAADGDSEGTPVSILEAGAAGLPVVSTRHAGIPDVVLEGKTGLLVQEGRIDEMAQHMLALAKNPGFADELGRNAAAHIRRTYTMSQSIRRLAQVLEAAASGSSVARVRETIEVDFAN